MRQQTAQHGFSPNGVNFPFGALMAHILSVQLRYSVPPVDYVSRIVRVGGCLAVVAQWQSIGGSSQRCPGFDSR